MKITIETDSIEDLIGEFAKHESSGDEDRGFEKMCDMNPVDLIEWFVKYIESTVIV